MKRLLLLMTFLFGMAVMQSCTDDNGLINDKIEQQKFKEHGTQGTQAKQATDQGDIQPPRK